MIILSDCGTLGRSAETRTTTPSHRDWVTIRIPRQAEYAGPCFHPPTVSTRPFCVDYRLMQPTAYTHRLSTEPVHWVGNEPTTLR